MAASALVMWTVGYAVVLGFQFLSHMGRPPAERLSPRRFAVVFGVAVALPLLFDRGLPVGSLAGDAGVSGVRDVVFGALFSVVWGLLFGAFGLVAYAVASGLPDESVGR